MNDNWNIEFIKRDDFVDHVSKTIEKYLETFHSFGLEEFNNNIIDPIKMVFDKAIFNKSWEEKIEEEVIRQKDKSNNNQIGYFHQNIFSYISGCVVPSNGANGGWDVIFESNEGIRLENGDIVHRIYAEVKNKHNTMNSSSASKTYIKMQKQLLKDDDCACFLVEAIAKKSQNSIWNSTIDGKKVAHNRIRRLSIDKFYAVVTGKQNAFYQICMALPNAIDEVLKNGRESFHNVTNTVYQDLRNIASEYRDIDEHKAFLNAIYMLGFSSYNGFDSLVEF